MNKFPKRISKAPKGALVEVVIELNDLQFEKLENKDLLPQIERIAKDLHLTWDVESDPESHDHMKLVVIGINMPWPIDDLAMHNADIKAANFMSAIDNLGNDTNVSTEEDAETTIDRIEFCRNALNNMHKTDDLHIVGAKLVISHPRLPFAFLEGCISKQLLMECFELYLEKHGELHLEKHAKD